MRGLEDDHLATDFLSEDWTQALISDKAQIFPGEVYRVSSKHCTCKPWPIYADFGMQLIVP